MRGRGVLLALPVILLCGGTILSAPEGFEVLAPTSGVERPEGVEPEPLTYPSAWEPRRADLQRGFTAGVVDTAESLTPDWLWPEPEPAQRIDLFGCRGQYLAVSIAVRALRPVREMRVVARALRGPGRQIAPEHIDLRWVQYLPEQDQDRWVWRGRWLEQALPRDLPGEHTAWLWMTVHVPDRTAAGLYSGELTIEDADGATLALPLHLRVLDVELQRPEGSYGFYMPGHLYSDRREGLHNYASEHLTAENLTPYFRFWRTRGLNSPTLFHIYPELSCVDGHAIGDFPQVRKFVRAMREAGIDGDLCLDLRFLEFWCNVAGEELARRRAEGASIAGDLGVAIGEGRGMLEPPDEAKRLFRELVEQLVAAAEAEDWPRTLLIADEEVANTDMKAATYDQYMPVILDVAPQRALLVDNAIGYGRPDAIDRGCRDGIPYRQYNNWTEEGLQCAREAGDEVRTYNYGWERSAWGLYQHFVGSAGNHQWADHWTSTTGPGWINTLITKQGVVSQPRLERIREGLDDLSYCRTLQRLASRLREAGRAAAADRAEEVLDEVVADLPVNRLDFRDWQQATPTAELDRRRWRVALAALQARRELGKDAAVPVGAAPGRPRLRGVASRRHQEEQIEKSLQAVRASQPVTIDGRLDEPVWGVSYNGTGALWWTWRREAAMRAEAGSVEEFERMPPPSYANAQFAWDASGLYLAVAANHSTLENSLCKHDTDDPGLWQDDCMEFFFQTDLSQSHYYHLIVNVCGARTLLSRNDLVSSEGIEVAQVSPVNDSGGYHQEIFVPWRRLGLDEPPHAGDVWRLQVGREFHSWNHITCWAQVNAQFAEQERWGVMMFGGEPGPVAITRLDLGARFPGRNRLQAALRATGEEAPGPVEARLLDQSGNPVATETLSLQAGAEADLALSYEIDPARLPGQPVEWRLVVVGDAGEELTSVPVPIPHVTRALGIEDCPGSAWSGQVIPIDLTVRLGDLSAPGQRLLGRLRSVAGGTVSLPPAPLAAGVRQRTWLDTGGLQPGRWRLELWADTGEPRPATATLEILPSPVAERP